MGQVSEMIVCCRCLTWGSAIDRCSSRQLRQRQQLQPRQQLSLAASVAVLTALLQPLVRAREFSTSQPLILPTVTCEIATATSGCFYSTWIFLQLSFMGLFFPNCSCGIRSHYMYCDRKKTLFWGCEKSRYCVNT